MNEEFLNNVQLTFLFEKMENSVGNGSLEFLIKNYPKERESSDYIKSWANATRGDSSLYTGNGAEILSSPMLKFEVIAARMVEGSKAKKYIAYTVMVRKIKDSDDPHPAVIERRYNDFLALYYSLKRDYPELVNSLRFPRKALVGNFTPEIISNRSAGFEEFLMSIAANKQLKESNAVMKFLQNREMLEAFHLIRVGEFDEAKALVENNFWLMNKMLTDRCPTVLRCLCLLVAVSAKSVRPDEVLDYATLALRRYQTVCDIDLLRYYIPLLHTMLEVCQRREKDAKIISDHIVELRHKGMNTDTSPPLLRAVLQDMLPNFEPPGK